MPESQARPSASRTQVVTSEPQPVLHLRHSEQTDQQSGSNKKPRVRWTQDVVDNENMNKKKSKICCIFHPQREFGESSDDSSSSSSDSSDSSGDEADNADHDDNHDGDHDLHHHANCTHKHKHTRKQKKRGAKASTPNAYEKQPQYHNQSKLPADAI